MNKQELETFFVQISAEDLKKRYGNIPLSFSDYYKYCFTYKDPDNKIEAAICEDVYRVTVTAKDIFYLKDSLDDFDYVKVQDIIEVGSNIHKIYYEYSREKG